MDSDPTDGGDESFSAMNQRFAGDFYCEPDDVHRGTALDFAAISAVPWPDPFGPQGDSPTGKCGALGGFGMNFHQEGCGFRGLAKDGCLRGGFSGQGGSPCAKGSVDVSSAFDEAAEAPEVPLDPLFKLELTTLEAFVSAAELGNRVMDLFADQKDVSIIKVNRTKMSLKAEASRPMPYMFKARIYRKGERHHAIEFQRRRGDGASFMQFFHRVQQVLGTSPGAKAPPIAGDIPERGFFDMSLPEDLPHEDASLQPFFDMAAQDADPLLKAEAAVGLANVVAQPSCAKELCTPEGFAALELILRSGTYASLSAAAVVLSTLVTQPAAMACFAEASFWQVLLDTIVAEGTCEDLKCQFARVAVDAYAFALAATKTSPNATQAQLQALRAAMKCTNISTSVHNTLAAATKV